MEKLIAFGKSQAKRILAVAVILVLLVLAQLPALSQNEKSAIASRFAFTRLPLPEVRGIPQKQEREVNPSLARHSAWISAVGASVALNDLDGDGLANDLCYVEPRTDQVIVAPVPGTGDRYQPLTLETVHNGYDAAAIAPMGCLPNDLNEDGRVDLLVYYWGRTPVTFLNHQEKALEAENYLAQELVPTVGQGEEWFTNAATFSDLDGDGHSDLIIGNYFPDNSEILNVKATNIAPMQASMTRAYNGGTNHIFRWTQATTGNNLSVQFEDVAGIFSENIAKAWTLAIGTADLDGDLRPEIYFANDFGPDRLLHNRSQSGQLQFALLEGEKGLTTPNSKVLGHDSYKGMGVDFADINQDGLLDIYVSNIADEYALEESHFLFTSTGKTEKMRRGIAPYVDQSESLGVSRSSWSWETKFGDFDNDGEMEALQATGFRKGETDRWPELQELALSNDLALPHPTSWFALHPGDDLSGHVPNPFYVRAKDGRYYDFAKELGLDAPFVTRGIATADVDGDGDLDFVIANQWEDSYFYRNDSPHHNQFLGLRLQLPTGSAAIGATAKVLLPNGRSLVSQVDGGNGHSGARSPELHFGLGDVSTNSPLSVEVQWRNRQGQPQQKSLLLSPGWHTVQLGDSAKSSSSLT
jgi:hypothetical protein